VCGSGRISARKSAAEDAALHAEGKDYSNGGGYYRHKEYFWTKALIGVFVSTYLFGYVLLRSEGELLARWDDRPVVCELVGRWAR